MTMSSVGPTPSENFYIYRQDETDKWAVHWRGSKWGTDNQADMRSWYHDPLDEEGYLFLLKHFGLPTGHPEFTFERVKKMSPQDLEVAQNKVRE